MNESTLRKYIRFLANNYIGNEEEIKKVFKVEKGNILDRISDDCANKILSKLKRRNVHYSGRNDTIGTTLVILSECITNCDDKNIDNKLNELLINEQSSTLSVSSDGAFTYRRENREEISIQYPTEKVEKVSNQSKKYVQEQLQDIPYLERLAFEYYISSQVPDKNNLIFLSEKGIRRLARKAYIRLSLKVRIIDEDGNVSSEDLDYLEPFVI